MIDEKFFANNALSIDVYLPGAVVGGYISTALVTGTNAFAGPTNNLNLALSDQTYATWTPVSVTNVSGYNPALSQFVQLTISNAAATNVTFTVPAQWRTDDGLRTWTVTNAQVRDVYVKVKNSMTNCITLPLY